MSLEPIDPETALDLYLIDRDHEVSQATIYSHSSRFGHFVRWCRYEDSNNLTDVTGRVLHRFRIWRREEGNLEPVTEKTQMDTLRVFSAGSNQLTESAKIYTRRCSRPLSVTMKMCE
ncbi:XerD/XerC family integrase [Halanaeroarchaeum sp. HSR-CO]|nr:XerD/XerC family integrase [Halanaeroarchaeum sp. HSR-CO]